MWLNSRHIGWVLFFTRFDFTLSTVSGLKMETQQFESEEQLWDVATIPPLDCVVVVVSWDFDKVDQHMRSKV